MELFLAFASLVAAVVPMVTYMVIIWWLDRNEREPFWMVLLCFFWGSTGAIVLAIIGSIIFQIPLATLIMSVADGDPSELLDLSGAVIVAPIVEEATKGVFLLVIALSRRFDGIVDGVVYGGAV
ncbi:MAG TPA: PrsW family glutamic-type intramembrane protease, partial [Ignavibacteria bacterium]|nr:PrsW family glutamic-type intramembrane protease [Ignavibacteria bacterium]